MARIWNSHIKHKAKIYFFIKFITFVLITWKYVYYNYEYTFSKHLEKRSIHNIALEVRSHRLLSRYSGRINEIHDNSINYKIETERKSIKTFERLKQGRSNNVEAYLNSYKHRYSKKGGLKKFDCYCEKKLFSSFNKLEKLAKQNNVSQSRINRIIYKKYFLPFFLLSLLPLMTFAIPKLVKSIKYKKLIFANIKTIDKTYTNVKTKLSIRMPSTNPSLQYIFLCISFIIVMLLIIYTYIKVMKYKRIRSGMSK